MKVIITIVAVLAVLGAIEALDSPLQLFREFIAKYDRHYKTNLERRLRYWTFVKNLGKIKHLQETEEGTAIYGINKFADFTEDEFRSLTGIKNKESNFIVPKPSPWPQGAPASFDWRDKNAVTGVKDQEACGNAGIFSAIANIEGKFALKHGILLSFSEQEVADCDINGEHCAGGDMPIEVYQAIIKIGGLETEADYPFVDKDQACKFDKSKVIAKLSGGTNLTNDETKLAAWLAQNGPVSVLVNANPFLTYVSGIIKNKSCRGGFNINHAITLVGYGTEHNIGYWIAKNSWGADWGEQGYVRLARDVDMCGVAEAPTSSIVI